MPWTLRLLILLPGIALLSACAELGYYRQAVDGHLGILWRAQPIEQVLADPQQPAALQGRLRQIQAARLFAIDHLHLPVGGAYGRFSPVDGQAVVWNVTAAPRYELTPHQWCYPVIGCQSYRGYYAQADAQRMAAQLAGDHDVWVSGVTAYSTLGWFDDPVLGTFVRLDEQDMIALLFHELAHRRVYVRDDTRFNESYATAVELEGLLRWLEHRAPPAQRERALRQLGTRMAFAGFMEGALEALRAAYRNSAALDEAARAAHKRRALDDLRQAYARVREGWPEPGLYDRWFEGELNNARLALVGNYLGWVNAFRQLLRDQQGDFAAFHREVARLAELPQTARDARLQALAARFDGVR